MKTSPVAAILNNGGGTRLFWTARNIEAGELPRVS
jgi:hypothetical protein